MARSLWLPGAEKSSANVPPPLAARKKTAPRTSDPGAMVRHGCLALAIATPRVNLSMVVPFGSGGVLSHGPEARQRCGERSSPHVVSGVVISVPGQRGLPYARFVGSDPEEGAPMADPLVETKLLLPRPRREVVPRPRLADLLDRGVGGPGHAGLRARRVRQDDPAGLLARGHAHRAAEDRAVAWVSLDERDRRATSFWTYVLLALDRASRAPAPPRSRSCSPGRRRSRPCSPAWSTS